MSKKTKIFIQILVLQFTSLAWAECPPSGDVLGSSAAPITKVMVTMACDEVLDSSDPALHDQYRCDQVDLCLGDTKNSSAEADAKAILKANIPKAALINALVDEVNANAEYNILLNNYELKNKKIICADKKIEKSCENNIREALNLVSGSFSDFPNLDRGPDTDILSKFALKKLYPQHNPVAKKMKDELKKDCDAKKINFDRVCSNSTKRIAEISACEKGINSKGCLDKEQKALASLLSSYKNNKDSFLALEKQLCLPKRLVQSAPLINPRLPMPKTKSVGNFSFSSISIPLATDSSASVGDGEASIGTASTAVKDEDVATNNSPSASNVVGLDPLKVESSEINLPPSDNTITETIVGVDSSESTVDLQDSFNEYNKNEGRPLVDNGAGVNSAAWNSDFANRINEIASEKKRKEDEAAALAIAQGDIGNSAKATDKDDKKKSDEMLALVEQINTLKAKIEEMNGNVDDLKSKKVTTADEKLKNDKEAKAREDAILELKKKLAALEEDKKIRQEQAIAKANEDERNRWREEARQAARVSSNFGSSNNGNENAQREVEKNNNAFNRSPSSFTESSANSVKGSSGAGASTASSGLTLKSVGGQSAADSSIIYMTAGELQKYPYRLANNASAAEIEKMISGNNGASIILGDSEQVIPVVVNGVVQLDESGKVKYKRVKISLVKNDKEKSQKTSALIVAPSDLLQEEQKKRDLIRYQEMKSSLKLK